MVAARFTKSQEKVKEQTGFLRARTRRQGYPRLRAHGADGSSRLEAAIRLRAVAGSRAAAKSAISNLRGKHGVEDDPHRTVSPTDVTADIYA